MSFGLLWIESLLVCLLFAALLITLGLRRRTWLARYALCAIGAIPPLLPFGFWVAFAIFMRLRWGMRHSGLLVATALLLCYLGGTLAIWVVAARRDAGGVRRAFFWPLGRMAGAWLVLAALLAMTVWNMDLQAQVQVQALRAEAGAMALSVAPPPIPDADNAARLYRLADERLKAATIPIDQDRDYDHLDPRSPEVAAYLQRQQSTLEAVRQAADTARCRFEHDYSTPDFDVNALMSELPPFRRYARLLEIAVKVEADAGDIDRALGDCRRIFGIGGHANSPYTLVSGMVSISIRALACHRVAQVLPLVTTKAKLDHFSPPDPQAMPPMFARFLRGEEAFGLAMFCDTMSAHRSPPVPTVPRAARAPVWFLWLRADVDSYRAFMRRGQRFVEQPYYQAITQWQQPEANAQGVNGYGPLTTLAAPSLLAAFRSMAKEQALESTVAVACAATRYRLDHGDYPPTADSLVPAHLAAIPVDPFDGRPLRWKKTGDGSVVIYSVGSDGVDNGGQVEGNKPADVGIVLKLPKAR